ncbi:type II toxin-antitoxin system RelE/ParE family toxin [candidate division KSB1 bacterium]|nr:type II toxin-antitoxin system RelE/ParE family toxin [candidate division KSB1 bacterium]
MITVKFRRIYLEKCYRIKSEAHKKWGPIVGDKYIKQLNLIYATESVKDLYLIPQLRFHPLKGDLEGHHSITLTYRARLIVKCDGDTIILIEKVSTKHYE